MRHSTLKMALLASAAFAALPALAQTTPTAKPGAGAPQAGAEQSSTLGEVVVTARRRDELAKDVPIADTAYSAARLDETGARDITDLQKTTPNVTLQVSRGTNSTLTAFIRGFGQQDPLWGFEPGVGLYLDDVYIQRPQAAVLDVFDVSSVEILRGPQGTLYGRNTIGGAIKYVTARIPDHAELDLRGQFGSYGEHDEIASAKGPLGDGFSASVAVAKYDHDGYGKNLTDGSAQYNKNELAVRATIEFKPTDKLFFRLSGDRTEDDSNTNNGHRELAYVDVARGVTWNVLPNDYDTQSGAGSKNRVYAEGLSFLAQADVSPAFTLKSISAYRKGRSDTTIDFDGTPIRYLDIPGQYKDHQFTQELQMLNSNGRLHGVAGVFYLDATASGGFDTVLANILPGGYTINTNGYVVTQSIAGYVDESFDITDKLQLELGARGTEDKKTGHVFRQVYAGFRSPMFGNPAAVALGAPNTNYTNSHTYGNFSPRGSLTYKFTPALTGYVTAGQGFQSGGFDMRGDAKAYPATVNGYKPERVTSEEIGLKGYLFDHRASFATDVFNEELKDQQITTQYPSGATIASVVDNVGASRVRGWEGEGSIRLFPSFTLNGQVGYINAKYLKWLAYTPGSPTCPGLAGCFVDVSNQRKFQNTPEWVGSISGTYRLDLGSKGSVRLTPSAAYRDSYQLFETPTPLLDQNAYWLYDADLVWTSASGRYEFGLHAKNLSDVRYHNGGYTFPGAVYGNSVTAFYGAPRTIFVTLAAKFD